MPSFTLKDKYITKSSKDRLYRIGTPILGLTGGIATGKSTASKILIDLGYLVIDADKLVKSIYNSNEAVSFIEALSAKCVNNGVIDFRALRNIFFKNKNIKVQIESFIYPRLRQEFLKHIPKNNKKLIIYDAPILFERELDKLVDQTILIYSPLQTQIERLIKRDSVDIKSAQMVIKSQISIEDKKNKANFVINNTSNIEQLKDNINNLMIDISN